MIKRLSILLLLCLSVVTLQAQSTIDSLQQIIKKADEDTTKVKALLHFFYTDLFYDDPEAVLDYTYQALKLSEKVAYQKGEIAAHNNLGYTYRIRSENDSSLLHYKTAIYKAKSINDYKGLTEAYIGLGNTYNQMGNWNQAIVHFEDIIILAGKKGDTAQVGSASNNLGNTYLNQSKWEKALKHYQDAAKMGDENTQEVALINIAVVHTEMGNLEQAKAYFQQGLEAAKRLNKKGHISFIYKNLGIVEKKSGNYDKAIAYYEKASAIYESMSDDYHISEILYSMGNIHFENESYDQAITMYKRSLALQQKIDHSSGACYSLLAIAMSYKRQQKYQESISVLNDVGVCSDSLGLLPTKVDRAKTLSEIYEETKDYEKAYRYFTEYKTLSDSLAGLRNAEKISELEAQYQTAQKEQEIELLNTENQVANLKLQKQQNLRNYLIIIAIILMLLIAVVYSRYKLKVKANSKLRDLDRIKTNFFTNISHEFRTPLTLIINPLSKIINTSKSKENKEELLLVQRNANRLLELTNQLMDLSKLEAGKMSLQVSPNNLSEFLKIIAASFTSLAQSRAIAFQHEQNTLPAVAYFDQDKLQKILNNLLSNAFKFTPEGGQVQFNADVVNDCLIINVKNTGEGLTAEQQHLIFERFHQNMQDSTVGGTGVGLTLTKELVQLHQGTITVESRKGEGANFMVSIPVDKASYKAFERVEPIEQNFESHKEHIETSQTEGYDLSADEPIALIVEDNTELRTYLSNLLNENFAVVACENGQAGYAKAIEIVPDIVVSDWMMPKMNGDELCKNLKKDERTSHIPVLLLTAKADRPSKIDALKIGADAYMTKPFDNEELLVRLDNLIRQREQLRHTFSQIITIGPSRVEINDPDKIFVEKALTVANSNLENAEFTVQDFQEEMGMSRMQLHRKLKALTNYSANEFVRNIRLQRAADVLLANGTSVADAAYSCGFNSLSYFSQCFKEKYGVTPSKYNG